MNSTLPNIFFGPHMYPASASLPNLLIITEKAAAHGDRAIHDGLPRPPET